MDETISIQKFTKITKALSDPHRIRALIALNKGELCVCQVIELLRLAPSTVSKHMSVLKEAGLVESRKDGRWIHYKIVDKENCSEVVRILIEKTVSFLRLDETIKNDNENLKKITDLNLKALCKQQKSI